MQDGLKLFTFCEILTVLFLHQATNFSLYFGEGIYLIPYVSPRLLSSPVLNYCSPHPQTTFFMVWCANTLGELLT